MSNENTFEQFNQNRTVLAQQFRELIGVIGNHVFHAQMDANPPSMLEEINRQTVLHEAEKNVLRHIHFFSTNLLNSRFLLGVLGRFKAGKSTLLNALAGEDISPMNTLISTGVLNFTYWNSQEECVVMYDSGQEFAIPPSEKTLYVDSRHNPDNEKGIHSVRHGSPNLDLQKEIMFVDTPGLEAVNRVHEKITLDFVAQCHAAVVVSTYPPFGETELRFYERIKEVIPNVFLVQNLPADKMHAWVELETQTLENLHKLGFYRLNGEVYPKSEVRMVLNKIADRKDVEELEKFKKTHHLHIYSLNAQTAYDSMARKREVSSREQEESRFPVFKNDLYDFLSRQQGGNLLAEYMQKGCLLLKELTQMVRSRKELLQKSLDEIEREIQEQEYQKQKTNAMLEMLVDRTTLKMIETHKTLKTQLMEKDLQELVESLNKIYGELNIFRLRKNQVKEIKLKIIEFNRLFGQRFQECVRDLQKVILEAQESISHTLENHGIFSKQEGKTSFTPVNMGEISGAGYIDYGVEIAFHGGVAYVGLSVAGAILGAGLLPALIGGAIGLGLSVPLSRYCAPVLEFGKDLIGKVAKRPANNIFENFRSRVREKLDEIEKYILDQMVMQFKTDVSRNTKDYFELFSRRLRELKEKKSHGMSQQECETECAKLQGIIDQLESIEKQMKSVEKKEEMESPNMQTLFKGIKGYFKKITQ